MRPSHVAQWICGAAVPFKRRAQTGVFHARARRETQVGDAQTHGRALSIRIALPPWMLSCITSAGRVACLRRSKHTLLGRSQSIVILCLAWSHVCARGCQVCLKLSRLSRWCGTCREKDSNISVCMRWRLRFGILQRCSYYSRLPPYLGRRREGGKGRNIIMKAVAH